MTCYVKFIAITLCALFSTVHAHLFPLNTFPVNHLLLGTSTGVVSPEGEKNLTSAVSHELKPCRIYYSFLYFIAAFRSCFSNFLRGLALCDALFLLTAAVSLGFPELAGRGSFYRERVRLALAVAVAAAAVVVVIIIMYCLNEFCVYIQVSQ